MSIKLMTLAWELQGMNCGQKLVLIALCDNASDAGQCWPSIETIAEKCCMGVRTVHRHIADLIEAGHIEAESRPGRTPIYTVHPCQNGTPAKSAPLPKTTGTPANLAMTPANLANHYISEPSREPSKEPRARGATPSRPDDVDAQTWSDWLTHRKTKRAAVTQTVIDEHRKQAQKAGFTLAQALAHCCSAGWQGFRADWVVKAKASPESFRERDARLAAERVAQATGGLSVARREAPKPLPFEEGFVVEVQDAKRIA